jgi:hypothetical protein
VRVDIDLAQRRVTGINEAVRCSCGNHDNVAGFHFALFIAGYASCASFFDNDDFVVIVPVQSRSAPGAARLPLKMKRLRHTFRPQIHGTFRQKATCRD